MRYLFIVHASLAEFDLAFKAYDSYVEIVTRGKDRAEQEVLPLTHEFLAEMLAVQRSTVSVVTRTLQMAGLIRQSRGGITVIDRAGLEETTCECYGKIRRLYQRLLPGSDAARDPSG